MSPSAPSHQVGTVKRLVPDRGFGFIRDDAGVEYFFHRSACDDYESLREGTTVSFRPGSSAKGARAEDVRIGQ